MTMLAPATFALRQLRGRPPPPPSAPAKLCVKFCNNQASVAFAFAVCTNYRRSRMISFILLEIRDDAIDTCNFCTEPISRPPPPPPLLSREASCKILCQQPQTRSRHRPSTMVVEGTNQAALGTQYWHLQLLHSANCAADPSPPPPPLRSRQALCQVL